MHTPGTLEAIACLAAISLLNGCSTSPPSRNSSASASIEIVDAVTNELSGKLTKPADGPISCCTSSQKGLDFYGREGDPVVAVMDGVIIYADSSIRGLGKMLMIRHANDYTTVYAHNRELLVHQGQSVKQGDHIAEMGRTDSPTTKLHFQLRKSGRTINAAPLLAEAPFKINNPVNRTPTQMHPSGITAKCHSSLAHLSTRIPSTGNARVDDIRNQALATDLMVAMKRANANGISPPAAVRAALDQARAFDSTAQESLRTASATDAFGATDDEFLALLRKGSLDMGRCEGIRNSALCSAAITKIGAIANRAAAAEMECHIRSRTWPK